MTGTASASETSTRITGPKTEKRNMCFGFGKHKTTKHGSLPLKFLPTGCFQTQHFGAVSEASFGVDDWCWPYVSVVGGIECWTLNGKPLAAGRVYLDVDGRDVLIYTGTYVNQEFRFARITFRDGQEVFLACDQQNIRSGVLTATADAEHPQVGDFDI